MTTSLAVRVSHGYASPQLSRAPVNTYARRDTYRATTEEMLLTKRKSLKRASRAPLILRQTKVITHNLKILQQNARPHFLSAKKIKRRLIVTTARPITFTRQL